MGINEKPLTSETSALLNGLIREGVKTHSAYDGSSRLTEFYVAPVAAQAGDPCLCTRYSYVGASNLVENSKDEKATWDASWDI